MSWDSFHSGLSVSLCFGEQDIMRSLHVVVFGEYIQALATHLKKLAPKKWEDILVQVNTDTTKLHNIFTKHRVSVDLLGKAGCWGPSSSVSWPPVWAGVLSSPQPHTGPPALGYLLSRQGCEVGAGMSHALTSSTGRVRGLR